MKPYLVLPRARSVAVLLFLAWVTFACGPPKQAPVQATAAPTATPEVAAPRLTIHFLDVGQGDAILVTLDGHRLLVDGGPSRERLHTRLGSLGITDIDAVLVTNPDADHIRGLIEAFSMFQVETFYSSESTNPSATYTDLLAAVAMEPGIQVVTLVRGQFVPLGGVQLEVLHPLAISGDRNDDSLALKLTCENVTVLLMGDATTTSETSMLAAGLVPKADVVKAGHHGSRTSSGDPFVEAAKPAYVVFSAGRDSQYGHPHAEVVARYLASGAQAVSTDSTPDDDTAVLTSDCQTYAVSGRAPGGATVTPVPTGPAATATPAATLGATATPGVACGNGAATITGLNKVREVVTLSASGDLTGWRLVSVAGSQTFDFPAGFVGSGMVQVESASPAFANTPSLLWWSTANVWSDSSNDDAALYDCTGDLIQTFDDGHS